MKRKVQSKDYFIILLSIFLICSMVLVESKKIVVAVDNYDLKIEASRKMEESLEEIRKEKINKGIHIDSRYDINMTGIIGVDFNGITTTLGSLESKRTSANPNFAAVIMDMLVEAGLVEGDNVAINFSSSFPGLNIATIIACEMLELNPIIISSIGSSTWGGNNLDFTYIDMEEHLFSKGLINTTSIAVSPGGAGDVGNDMNKNDLDIIISRVKEYGKEIIIENDLQANIKQRLDLYYNESSNISCFINVGGNIISFGNTMDSLNTPFGLIKDIEFNLSEKSGLVQNFYSKEVPVIHLLNIVELSHSYGMKADSDVSYEVGQGDVYYTSQYPYRLIILVLGLTGIALIIFKIRMKDDYE